MQELETQESKRSGKTATTLVGHQQGEHLVAHSAERKTSQHDNQCMTTAD